VVLALKARTPLAILADQKKRERFPLECGKWAEGSKKWMSGVSKVSEEAEEAHYALFGLYRRFLTAIAFFFRFSGPACHYILRRSVRAITRPFAPSKSILHDTCHRF